MKNKNNLENKISSCHFPSSEAWVLPPRDQVLPFSTVCFCASDPYLAGGMVLSFPPQLAYPCRAALHPCLAHGSPREAARWGEEQICWDKRHPRPLRKKCHWLAQFQPLESKTRECREGEGTLQTTESWRRWQGSSGGSLKNQLKERRISWWWEVDKRREIAEGSHTKMEGQSETVIHGVKKNKNTLIVPSYFCIFPNILLLKPPNIH